MAARLASPRNGHVNVFRNIGMERWAVMDKQQEFALRTVEERDVRFIRLWFTDVLGTPYEGRIKNLFEQLIQLSKREEI